MEGISKGPKFEREQGEVCGKVWKKERGMDGLRNIM